MLESEGYEAEINIAEEAERQENIIKANGVSIVNQHLQYKAVPANQKKSSSVTTWPRRDKCYESYFQLDVSMDANVVVNAKRKKKADVGSTKSPLKNTDSPRTRSKRPGLHLLFYRKTFFSRGRVVQFFFFLLHHN